MVSSANQATEEVHRCHYVKQGMEMMVEQTRKEAGWMNISPAVLCLLAICLADTVVSMWLFHHQVAVEWNPLLQPSAQAGLLPFFGAKSLTFMPCAVYMEWYRRRRPQFARFLLWGACAAYVAIYAVSSIAQFLRSG